MKRRLSLASFLLSAALVLLGAGLGGCTDRPEPIQMVTIQADTPLARKETMAGLRAAWRARSAPSNDHGKRAELRFLVRLASAVRKFEDTESYGDICKLWNDCLKDHLARFPESAG